MWEAMKSDYMVSKGIGDEQMPSPEMPVRVRRKEAGGVADGGKPAEGGAP